MSGEKVVGDGLEEDTECLLSILLPIQILSWMPYQECTFSFGQDSQSFLILQVVVGM